MLLRLALNLSFDDFDSNVWHLESPVLLRCAGQSGWHESVELRGSWKCRIDRLETTRIFEQNLTKEPIKLRSIVGLIPLFAVEVQQRSVQFLWVWTAWIQQFGHVRCLSQHGTWWKWWKSLLQTLKLRTCWRNCHALLDRCQELILSIQIGPVCFLSLEFLWKKHACKIL